MRDLAPIGSRQEPQIVDWIDQRVAHATVWLADFGEGRIARFERTLGYEIVQAGDAWLKLPPFQLEAESNCDFEPLWIEPDRIVILKNDRVIYRIGRSDRRDGASILMGSSWPVLEVAKPWQDSLLARG